MTAARNMITEKIVGKMTGKKTEIINIEEKIRIMSKEMSPETIVGETTSEMIIEKTNLDEEKVRKSIFYTLITNCRFIMLIFWIFTTDAGRRTNRSRSKTPIERPKYPNSKEETNKENLKQPDNKSEVENSDVKKIPKKDDINLRTGGAYIPPAKLRMMAQNITDKSR